MTQEHSYIIEELARELGARRDGSGRNLIARCPYCGKEGKYGVYIGPEMARKKPFMTHCFSCGASTHSLERTLEALGRLDLLPTRTTDPEAKLDCSLLFPLDAGEEIDDGLGIVELPEFCAAPSCILTSRDAASRPTTTSSFRWEPHGA